MPFLTDETGLVGARTQYFVFKVHFALRKI